MVQVLRKIFRLIRPRPQISVIVPIFNKCTYISDCLDSILSQENVDIEVLCIDDESSDGSVDIVKSYMKRDDRIFLYQNSSNLGPASSRNIGIDVARGEFLQFTDADDFLSAGALRTLLDASREHGVPVVRGGVQKGGKFLILYGLPQPTPTA